MIEAVVPEDFVLSFVASALIVLFGAGYAALFAWSRISGRKGLSFAAGACYAALVYAVLLLSRIAHFDGYWHIVAGLMLIGYLLAPWCIWRLCAANHEPIERPGKLEH